MNHSSTPDARINIKILLDYLSDYLGILDIPGFQIKQKKTRKDAFQGVDSFCCVKYDYSKYKL